MLPFQDQTLTGHQLAIQVTDLGQYGRYGNLGFEGQMESLTADGLVSKYPPAPLG